MADGNGNQTIVTPAIKEFCENLSLMLAKNEQSVEIFRNGTPEQKLEQILVQSDLLLEPTGNFILLNADLPLKNLLDFQDSNQ